MLRTTLAAGVIAVLSLALVALYGPPRVQAATFIVTSSADSGPGSFRAAIGQASSSSSSNQIILANRMPITLQSPVVYAGAQNLTILGNGISNRVIQGTGFDPNAGGTDTGCSLFESTEGADLTLIRVTFQNTSCHGVEVYGASGDGEISVTLNSVIIRNMGGAGLYLDEGIASSDAGWDLQLISSRLEETGYYGHPAVNVHEYDGGNVTVSLTGTSIVNNWGEGLNLDEDDSGYLSLTASSSKFNGNGEDFEPGEAAGDAVSTNDYADGDGIDARECGDGNLVIRLSNVQANDNGQDGIALEECDLGALEAGFTSVRSNNNGGDGFRISEDEDQNFDEGEDEEPASQGGALTVQMTWVSASGNGSRGVSLSEQSEGRLAFRATGLTASDNLGDTGVEVWEFDEGALDAVLTTVVANGNGDHGIGIFDDISEADDEPDGGALTAQLINVSASGNDGSGAYVNESGPGASATTVRSLVVDGNGDQGLHLTEDDEGPINTQLTGVSARGNFNSGVLVQEFHQGGVAVAGRSLLASENGEVGLRIEERDEGDTNVDVSSSTFEENEQDGARVNELDDGRLDLSVTGTTANENGSDGWETLESGEGGLAAIFVSASADGNVEYGIRAEEQGGTGTLSLTNTSLAGNGLGATLLTNVVIAP